MDKLRLKKIKEVEAEIKQLKKDIEKLSHKVVSLKLDQILLNQKRANLIFKQHTLRQLIFNIEDPKKGEKLKAKNKNLFRR